MGLRKRLNRPINWLRRFLNRAGLNDGNKAMNGCHLRFLPLFALLGTAVVSPATGQQVEWAQRAGGPGGEEGGDFDAGVGITTDADGNIYVTGLFSGIATFGTGAATQTIEASQLAFDTFETFVAKYAPTGKLLWAKHAAGGGGENLGTDLVTDSSGNIYVTGSYQYETTFGAGEPKETTLVNAGDDNSAYVAKFTKNGALLWAKSAHGFDDDSGNAIVVDGSGYSYVAGSFGSRSSSPNTATFGEGDPLETVLEGIDEEGFVAKYTPGGVLKWAIAFGGVGDDSALDIARDGQGNLVVVGAFSNIATFGPYVLEASDDSDVVIVKLSSTGTVRWAKSIDGDFNVFAGVGTDKNNNIYVTGSFSGTATFGAGDPNETTLTSASGRDIFLAKLNSNGQLQWAKGSGGAGNDGGAGLAVDPSNNVYVTGSDDNSVFLAKYTPAGALLAHLRATGRGADVATDRRGNAYVTGTFSGTTKFGQTTLTDLGSQDIFIVKYRPAASAIGR
jgi:hypothetical protein